MAYTGFVTKGLIQRAANGWSEHTTQNAKIGTHVYTIRCHRKNYARQEKERRDTRTYTAEKRCSKTHPSELGTQMDTQVCAWRDVAGWTRARRKSVWKATRQARNARAPCDGVTVRRYVTTRIKSKHRVGHDGVRKTHPVRWLSRRDVTRRRVLSQETHVREVKELFQM